MAGVLTIRAGATAMRCLADGWRPEAFSVLIGASGGPKWLVLSRIDRVLAIRFTEARTRPLAMLGSSIGVFRHLCFAQSDPVAALDRFERAYIAQAYEHEPTPVEVSAESRRVIGALFGPKGRREVLANPLLRSHIVTARSRAALACDSRYPLMLGLGAAAAANAFSRGALRAFFERVVFHSGPRCFRFDRLSTAHVALTEDNLEAAALASGSIPMVMQGVDGIPGADPGRYRDGGLTDYHFDFDFDTPDGLILYPHFFEHVTPGWFDKPLVWRRARGRALDRTVLIAPSERFVDSLPGAKVPDREDFRSLSTAERQRRWSQVVDRCGELADELEELMLGARFAAAARPFV